MESAYMRHQAMTFSTLLFKLAHGIFMTLFRKGQGWWVIALLGDSQCGFSLLRLRAGWRIMAGLGMDANMKLKKEHQIHACTNTHTHIYTGRSWQALDWLSHGVLIFVTVISISHSQNKGSAPWTAPVYSVSTHCTITIYHVEYLYWFSILVCFINLFSC